MELSELITTRIIHDLIGNSGVICNSVELLEEGDDDFMTESFPAFKFSAGLIKNRLTFFRQAFGLNNGNWAIDEVKKNIENYLSTINYPIALNFNVSSPELGKASMLGVMIGVEHIIRGGGVFVNETGDGLEIMVQSNHPCPIDKINKTKNIITGKDDEKSATYAPVLYLKSLHKLSVSTDDNLGVKIWRTV